MSDFTFCENALFFSIKQDFANLNVENELKKLPTYGKRNVCENGTYAGLNYNFIMFKTDPKPPTFYKGSDNFWKEIKIAYILLVYNEDYIAILKQNTNIPHKIEERIQQIDYEILLKIFINRTTEYKHLSMQNTDGSDSAIRSKSYNAVDLKRNISTVSASKYFIQNMRGSNGINDSFALNTNTSRINQFKQKKDFNQICTWTKDIFHRLKKIKPTKHDKGFLSHFANHEKFDNAKNLKPSSILLHTQSLLDILNYATEASTKVANTIKKKIPIYEVAQKKVFETNNEVVFQLNGSEKIILKILKNRIEIKNDLWEKCDLSISTNDETESTTLEAYINKENLFSVFFDDKTFTYSNGQLFSNHRLINDAQGFLHFFKKEPLLDKVDCEKFLGKQSSNGKRTWDADSEFQMMVNHYSDKHNCFICDDCKTEWADFIGIDKNQVTFYACKYAKINDDSASASKFHDVISQALKNLGNLSPTERQLGKKRADWKNTYLQSQIRRSKSTNNEIDNAVDNWRDAHHQPNFKKNSVLVVNFISYSGLKKRFKAVQNIFTNANNSTARNDETTFQQIWLISSFISTCLEAGITPKIICGS